MSEPALAQVHRAAMEAAVEMGHQLGVEVRYLVISCVLEDDTFGTAIPEFTGPLRALQMIAASLGAVSKRAGCEVTVLPLPVTGRSQG